MSAEAGPSRENWNRSLASGARVPNGASCGPNSHTEPGPGWVRLRTRARKCMKLRTDSRWLQACLFSPLRTCLGGTKHACCRSPSLATFLILICPSKRGGRGNRRGRLRRAVRRAAVDRSITDVLGVGRGSRSHVGVQTALANVRYEANCGRGLPFVVDNAGHGPDAARDSRRRVDPGD